MHQLTACAWQRASPLNRPVWYQHEAPMLPCRHTVTTWRRELRSLAMARVLDLVSHVTKAVRGYRGHGAVSCSALVQGVVRRQQWYWRSVGLISCPCCTCLHHDSVVSPTCADKRQNKAVGRTCGDSQAVSL